jgi:hypothetical protein
MNEGTAATATLDITGAAPTTLSGTYQLSGDALLEFASGGVTAIGSGADVTERPAVGQRAADRQGAAADAARVDVHAVVGTVGKGPGHLQRRRRRAAVQVDDTEIAISAIRAWPRR